MPLFLFDSLETAATSASLPPALHLAQILKKHPEINALMGPCPWTKYQVALVVSMQLGMCYAASQMSWALLVPVAYALGGAANCNLQLAMHEISHNLAFKGTTRVGMVCNRLLSLVANLPLGIPAAISFRKYHLEHHRCQVCPGRVGGRPAVPPPSISLIISGGQVPLGTCCGGPVARRRQPQPPSPAAGSPPPALPTAPAPPPAGTSR